MCSGGLPAELGLSAAPYHEIRFLARNRLKSLPWKEFVLAGLHDSTMKGNEREGRRKGDRKKNAKYWGSRSVDLVLVCELWLTRWWRQGDGQDASTILPRGL